MHSSLSKSTITIIIPTCNRRQVLRECLMELQRQIVKHPEVAVVISDDSTSDETRHLVNKEFPKFMWMQGPRKGPGPNRNHATLKTNSEFIIFIDDDIVPSPGFLSGYIRAIKQYGMHEKAFVGPTISHPLPKSLLWEAPHNPNGDFPQASNWAFNRESFVGNGLFDERFRGHFEDVELFARLKHNGIHFKKVPDAVVYHPPRKRPNICKLARRHECRVICGLDHSCSGMYLFLRLPISICLENYRRFRGERFSLPNICALLQIPFESLIVLVYSFNWIRYWKKYTPSPFWRKLVQRSIRPVKRLSYLD